MWVEGWLANSSAQEESQKTWQLIRDLEAENVENAFGIPIRLWLECFRLMIYRFQIYEYSQQMDDNVEKEISCDVTLKIIDMILLNETSLNKPMVRMRAFFEAINFPHRLTDWFRICFLFSFFSHFGFVFLFSIIKWHLNEQQVKKLQDLVQLVTINRESTSFVLPVSSPANPKSISSSASISPMRQLKSLQIFKSSVKTLPFSHQIYG